MCIPRIAFYVLILQSASLKLTCRFLFIEKLENRVVSYIFLRISFYGGYEQSCREGRRGLFSMLCV